MSEITNILEEVTTEICDNYCKYPVMYSDDEYEKMLNERCGNCPLNRIN